MPTIENDVDLGYTEDVRLPSDGTHSAILAAVSDEFTQTKKAQSGEAAPDQEQIIMTFALTPDDPDCPNFAMRKYVGWPAESDKTVFRGMHSAYWYKIQDLKQVLTAFGGMESGALNQQACLAFFHSKIGMAVKVRTKQDLWKATGEMQANIDEVLPA